MINDIKEFMTNKSAIVYAVLLITVASIFKNIPESNLFDKGLLYYLTLCVGYFMIWALTITIAILPFKEIRKSEKFLLSFEAAYLLAIIYVSLYALLFFFDVILKNTYKIL